MAPIHHMGPDGKDIEKYDQDGQESDFSHDVYLERYIMQEAGKLPFRHEDDYYRSVSEYPAHMDADPKDNMPRTWYHSKQQPEPLMAEERRENQLMYKQLNMCSSCYGPLEPNTKYKTCGKCRERSRKKYHRRHHGLKHITS